MLNFFLNLLTAAPAEAAAGAADVVFQPASFIENLQYMGIGMLVIFLVIGLIILSTKLINFLFSDSGEK